MRQGFFAHFVRRSPASGFPVTRDKYRKYKQIARSKAIQGFFAHFVRRSPASGFPGSSVYNSISRPFTSFTRGAEDAEKDFSSLIFFSLARSLCSLEAQRTQRKIFQVLYFLSLARSLCSLEAQRTQGKHFNTLIFFVSRPFTLFTRGTEDAGKTF